MFGSLILSKPGGFPSTYLSNVFIIVATREHALPYLSAETHTLNHTYIQTQT